MSVDCINCERIVESYCYECVTKLSADIANAKDQADGYRDDYIKQIAISEQLQSERNNFAGMHSNAVKVIDKLHVEITELKNRAEHESIEKI